jgi:hypothetical protein
MRRYLWRCTRLDSTAHSLAITIFNIEGARIARYIRHVVLRIVPFAVALCAVTSSTTARKRA